MPTARNDQTSLSFGRRLNRAEQELNNAKAEIKTLQDILPEAKHLQAAAAKIEDQQRRSVRLLKDPSSSEGELASIDPTALSTASREILRSRLASSAAGSLGASQVGVADIAHRTYKAWRWALPSVCLTNIPQLGDVRWHHLQRR